MKMKYPALILLTCCLLSGDMLAAAPRKTSIVSYTINAELNTRKKIITASETIRWKNTERKAARTMRFHLYYNAFSGAESEFLKEDGWHKKSPEELKETRFGGITITSLRIINGPVLTKKITFPTPDNKNKNDKTVMEVRLPRPVAPGKEIEIAIDFTVKLPDIISRTGVKDEYYFIAQWFPKPGVFMKDGTWHCHQYHYNAEYFADYGDFRVSLTVPSGYIIGATGNLEKKLENSDGTVTRIYTEENIHDFAWTAWPKFKRDLSKVSLRGKKEKTVMEILYAPRHENALTRNKESLLFAMNFYAKHILPYPYKKITLVDAPMKGMHSWGMEYPGLITTGHVPFIPDFYRLAEKITIHEFGHQYWYGIIGTDETKEAWLDEGINTFFEMEIMEAYNKGKASFIQLAPLNLYDWQDRRGAYTSMVHVDSAATPSWEFMEYSTYRGNVYAKTALLFLSLKSLTGKKRLYGFFRYFARKWKYKHPTGEDFIKDFNQYMRHDYTWVFDQFIKNNLPLDQRVHSLESTEVDLKAGKFLNEILVTRGPAWFPVDLRIDFADGSKKTMKWKDPGPWKRFTFHSKEQAVRAILDPEYRIPLDINFINNSICDENEYSGFGDFTSAIGTFMQTIISFLVF